MTKSTLKKVQKILQDIYNESGTDIVIELKIMKNVAIYQINSFKYNIADEVDYYDENAILDYVKELEQKLKNDVL